MNCTEIPIRTMEDLVAALRARRMELGLSHLDVDDAAGLQGGYTGKIECGDRNLGPLSFAGLLGALGVVLRLECAAGPLAEEIPEPWAKPAHEHRKKWRLKSAKGGRASWGESTAEERKRKMRRVWMASVKSRREKLKGYGEPGKNPAKTAGPNRAPSRGACAGAD